ncbi:hypothetical protein [Thalassoroseus pseudoceratinae]|uniref:hypothetical protein n=1 Tax=Thalassoroseus pseudoceratinae TaxID=2713176 RepID=UPI00141E0166|nr:hypothetical protein [Thalassoroseus pseudoceratinae]
MGKLIGLLTCTAVVGVAVWLATTDQPTKLASAREEAFPQAETSQGSTAGPTARELLSAGTQQFNAGRYAEAARLFKAAESARGELNRFEQQDLQNHLKQAQEKLSNGGSGIDPKVAQQIQALMSRAELAARQGRKSTALRFANSAATLARRHQVDFAPNQATPDEFIAQLRGLPAPQRRPVARPVTKDNNDPFSRMTVQTLPEPNPTSSAAAAEFPAMETKPMETKPNATPKERALALMKSARTAYDRGDVGQARAYAIEAKNLNASYTLFEESPEQLLKLIGQESATTAILAKQEKPAQEANPFGAKTPAKEAPKQTASLQRDPQVAAKKQQAAQLLTSAQQDIVAGRYDSAREKAQQAERLDVAYDRFDVQPFEILAQIKLLEANNLASKPATPAVDPQADANRKQARELLGDARKAAQSGDFATADAKIAAARKLDVTFDPFDETPDTVARYVENRKFLQASTTPAASPTPKQVVDNPFASNDPFKSQDGKTAPAETKPKSVEVADSKPSPTTSLPNGVPVVPVPTTKLDETIDSQVAQAVVQPSGVSAVALFDRGMKHFNDGDTSEAYDAFLSCYRTGQQMDPWRSQTLQDMLQALRSHAKSKSSESNGEIRQVSAEFGEGKRIGPGTEATPELDAAQQELAIRYDKLRSEVMNAVFKADRLREKDSTKALEVIDRATTSCASTELSPEQVKPLLRQLRQSRADIEEYQKQRAPILALEEQNRQVQEKIRTEMGHKIRVEQELAALVEEYNELFKQRRFAEAEVLAKQAQVLDPENPVTVTMAFKAKIARRSAANMEIRDAVDESSWTALNKVEESMINPVAGDSIAFPKNWEELSKRRSKYGSADNRIKTEQEKQIERSLQRPISLHFDNVPIREVLAHIATTTGVNIVVDDLGLEEEGVMSDTPVTIHVDGIMLRSALNLMLNGRHLAYLIEDEVLKITSEIRAQGKLEVRTYPVADLVVPIPNSTPSGPLAGISGVATTGPNWNGAGNYNIPPAGALQPVGGGQFQVGDQIGGASFNPWANPNGAGQMAGGASAFDFDTLTDLIISTIEPGSWAETAGGGNIRSFETTLSLVVRQTQAVHEEIRDLLEQLRRLQDLQVTVEVRFITVADRFAEQIGVDFDFNVQDNVEGDTVGLPAFGTRTGNAGTTGQNQNNQGNNNQGNNNQGNNTTTGGNLANTLQGTRFDTPTDVAVPALDDYPKNGTVAGIDGQGGFTPDLDIGFQQGSFDLGAPDFGNFNPQAGIEVGFAILTDIEAFFFIRAAQVDERTNIMFAPKVTLFNGQSATVSSSVDRPFVTSLIPTVGFFSVGFTPQITVVREGTTLQVSAVVSADRRFVRLTVNPVFSNLTDVFTFSFAGGAGGAGTGNGAANVGTAGGGQLGIGQGGGQLGAGGQIGGQVGGQIGGQAGGQIGGGQLGIGGIGGGPLSGTNLLMGLPSQLGAQFGAGGIGGIAGGGAIGGQIGGQGGGQIGGQVGGNVGQGGNQGNTGIGGAGTGTLTIQQPVVETVNVTTTVSVPDGGTVLLGGVKRLREGRNMAGVPILNKLPYISRLFKNTGVGRETESLMMMVTPRIIIQEEEEELLIGVPQDF